jgi:NAD/NADP transhydrogenase alpha subunit
MEQELIKSGHTVVIERGAGEGSGFSDDLYIKSGCQIFETACEVYRKSDMIVKVKEPLEPEYNFVRENQVIFTYFHFASCPVLTNAMIKSKAVCIAYETVARADKSLPLLVPMSEIAGRMSVQCGARYLERPMGVLLFCHCLVSSALVLTSSFPLSLSFLSFRLNSALEKAGEEFFWVAFLAYPRETCLFLELGSSAQRLQRWLQVLVQMSRLWM